MRNSVEERKVFWQMYQSVLDEKGMPFTIICERQWAVVNSYSSKWRRNIISMDFSLQKHILRINAYLDNDLSLYAILVSKKEEIEDKLGFAPVWGAGEKKGNARRIKVELPFVPYDRNDYVKLIEQSIPIVQRFVEAFKPYIKYD
ncbi:MAG: DUF4268 domain-containing protein [Clostridiales bacterium]|nr:DUF4268 domain-containing protein [Clostridiales bacterium]